MIYPPKSEQDCWNSSSLLLIVCNLLLYKKTPCLPAKSEGWKSKSLNLLDWGCVIFDFNVPTGYGKTKAVLILQYQMFYTVTTIYFLLNDNKEIWSSSKSISLYFM